MFRRVAASLARGGADVAAAAASHHGVWLHLSRSHRRRLSWLASR